MSGGPEQIEGRRAVTELLRAGRRRPQDVWLGGDALDEIERLARAAGVCVRHVDRDTLAKRARTSAPQGVVAFADPLPDVDLDALLGDAAAFLLALDRVTDPQNVGAVIRSAEAAGVTGIVLPRHRGARFTPAVAKAAAGAIEHVPIATVAGVPAAIERARRRGVWVVGLDADGDTDLADVAVASEPVMLVLGSEGDGLSRLARLRCDVVARIPMRGAIESLNVAAAGAIACFDIARRRSTLGQTPE